jgi:DNA polymerase II small subunit/DNA polymerase delta subunit B
MESGEKSFWGERLKDFEDKSVELREKTSRLEEEIKSLEGSLYRKNITAYRTSIIDRAKKTFIRNFRQRDELHPEPEAKEEWEQLTNMMSACITVIKSIDTEEASVCSGVEELREYLKNEIEAKTELPFGEAARLLEG